MITTTFSLLSFLLDTYPSSSKPFVKIVVKIVPPNIVPINNQTFNIILIAIDQIVLIRKVIRSKYKRSHLDNHILEIIIDSYTRKICFHIEDC
jgi:hypothetical protein